MAHNCSEGDFEALDSRDFDLESQEEKTAVSRARDYFAVCLICFFLFPSDMFVLCW